MLRGNVLLVTGSSFLRLGLKQALAQDTLTVVGDVPSAEAALSLLGSTDQDIDLLLFHADLGAETHSLSDIAENYPEMGIVIIATDLDHTTRKRARDCGAKALLPSTVSADALNLTLQLVILGENLMFLPAEPTDGREPDQAVPGFGEAGNQLSPREVEILSMIKEGAPNKVIARQLDVAEATVKVHVKSLLRKIHVANRTQAAIWALHHPAGA